MADHDVLPGSEAFEQVVALLDYPMFVVTTRVGDQRAGCLVGFSSQVSINPSRFLVGLSKKNHTYRVAADGATHLAVHLLAKEHKELARLFGSETGDRVDKFSRCDWWEGARRPADPRRRRGMVRRARSGAVRPGRPRRAPDRAGGRGAAPEQFGDLVTFADVKDLEPGHEA